MEPETLRLGIDLDGVVADFHAGWVRRYCEDFDAAIRPEHVVGWDSLTELTHFDDDGAFWSWASACEPGIFRYLPLVDGAAPTLRALAEDHRVVIITAKASWAVPDTLAWLAEHRLPVSDVHFTFEKQEIACDVYLDDSPHHLVNFLEEHPGATVCRMVRAWNEPVDGAVDVHTWGEFATIVDEVAGSASTGGGATADGDAADGSDAEDRVGGGAADGGAGDGGTGDGGAGDGGAGVRGGAATGGAVATNGADLDVGRERRVRQT